MTLRPATILLAVFAASLTPIPPARATALSDELAARLPREIRAPARSWLDTPARTQSAWLALSPGDLRREVIYALAGEPAAADFILEDLPREPAATDLLVLKVIGTLPFWTDHKRAAGRLEDLAGTAADPDLALALLDAARRLQVAGLREVLTRRIGLAREKGDAGALARLAAADEDWMLNRRAAMLPGFLRRPSPVFPVVPAGGAIRVVGFGDFGTGSTAQRDVAATIGRMHSKRPFDFGITFGDNFYPSGMASPADPRWTDWWDALYGPLGITFYPVLGNHEWYSADGAAAEILHQSASWHFPSPYYTFTAGPVQFFAIDTTEISEAQLLWLAQAIASSLSRWKVVYGHHQIFAPEQRTASSVQTLAYMQGRLWPLLRGRVDAYLCGHQHAMAHMQARDGVHFFMSGGGGAPLSAVSRTVPDTRFVAASFGFLTLEADASAMRIALFDGAGLPLDSEVLTKP